MRVLRALLFSVFVVGIVAGLGWLVAREVILWMALSQLREGLVQVRTIAKNPGIYLQECQKKGSYSIGETLISTVQLRLLSPTNYAVEVLCAQFDLQPIEVMAGALPGFARALPGSSGVVWGDSASGVGVEVWGRKGGIGVVDQSIVRMSASDVGNGPKTSCEGYGYTCCAAESQVGKGEVMAQATDCPRSCYQQCQSRPIVLSLTTQPFYDQSSREVELASGEQVEFGYVVEWGSGLPGQVKIEFGDGTQETSSEASGSISHTYTCGAGVCRYPVTVSAVDGQGVSAAASAVTGVVIVVR
jgi:hypothetical protein